MNILFKLIPCLLIAYGGIQWIKSENKLDKIYAILCCIWGLLLDISLRI